ncbi:hypothetical protein DPEC_G00238290 [Dallia pectoralis]|uniref:Uncharacterized protein n=1 Tax=Dallia pectoralis TaxID=75939 RepID=A0ACC2FYT6_DALPE|nr:hypothetical protein DPEC_G00238290 [Dallia pectoralis]
MDPRFKTKRDRDWDRLQEAAISANATEAEEICSDLQASQKAVYGDEDTQISEEVGNYLVAVTAVIPLQTMTVLEELFAGEERAMDHPVEQLDQQSKSPSRDPALERPASTPYGGRPFPLMVGIERHPVPAG